MTSPARWDTVLDYLLGALPSGGRSVRVGGGHVDLVADRLRGRGITVTDGPAALTVWVRAAGTGRGDADVVLDLHDPQWPVLRHVRPGLLAVDWHRTESQAFFAVRAATWDSRFGDDLPAYALAVAEADLPRGGFVVDIGCGTGRALPALRTAVGPEGRVCGLDHTAQMVDAARPRARSCGAGLLLADARRLPFAARTVDAVFAAGLLHHLPSPADGLVEWARVTRPGGRLVLFHPSGRAALAARHGRTLSPDEPLAEPVLRALTARTGWRLTGYDDPAHRFHALAIRV